MVSRELEKECIVVFDEAHNIDNVCIEVRKSCQTMFFAQPGCISSLQSLLRVLIHITSCISSNIASFNMWKVEGLSIAVLFSTDSA